MRISFRFGAVRVAGWFIATVFCALSAPLPASDWTQYRGSNHDGISTELIRMDWAQNPPRRLWKRSLEPGLSSFSIGGGKAFTQVRRRLSSEDQEFCIALDADTGQELWATPLGIADYPDGGVGFDDGPRSTPTVDGNRVYVFSTYLKLACLDAATGAEVWSKDFVEEFGSTPARWQNAASPVLVGDLIYVNSNVSNRRLMALHKEDGRIVWSGQNDRMTQATPVYADVAGVPQVIFFAQSGLVSVSPESGTVLWRFPMSFSTSTAASPVVAEDVVYCSAAYGVGAGAVRVTKDGSAVRAAQIWKTPGANMNHWATPVHHEGFLYGLYGQSVLSLRCIEVATGAEKWRQGGVGYGSVLFVAGHLLMLTEQGDLVLVEPNSLAYTEVVRFKGVSGKCWNIPAISDGRIYVRSTTEAAAYDVSVAVTPKPKLKLQPTFAGPNDFFRLFISNEDGSQIEASRAANISIFVSSDLGGGAAAWTRLNQAAVLANGQLQIDDQQSASTPQRFFRTEEKP